MECATNARWAKHIHMHMAKPVHTDTNTQASIRTSSCEDSNCLAVRVADAWCEMKSGSVVGNEEGARPMSLNSV